ncbi:MAG: LysM peptidoglycan-binding domain-containing protein [Flavobacterium sp.]|nr:LysM peptidoglycan-binding domain-containing protein [Flavobacterium sp.]
MLFFFSSCVAKANQEPYIKHIVTKGETIYQIAVKYQVTPFDIFRINPDAKNGIQENTVLLIPKNTSKITKEETKNIIHEVKAKETLYSIAKEYEVSIDQIKEWNEELLKDGLKKGQEIIVGKEKLPINESYVEVQKTKTATESFSHKVQPKETLYGIATKYDMSIEEIIAQNPDTKDGLKEGTI